MDISRAVQEFVVNGQDLYRRLRGEGEALSSLDLHILHVQIRILEIEVIGLKVLKAKYHEPGEPEMLRGFATGDVSAQR
ncbi:hypothetical protein W02_31710 [Nitrospira sp. KM1]|uniref:hypothetical protein n=1 Tax=Nitrospira sp. KM1 TaxID=1936990 RepID=UPI0013A7AE29|nr:hypothetical protein [Nitrospira sp. KM1]BCA56031.1 hypothetical protein W02_31710 [Nitrospira sp. KM1]